MDHLSYLVLQVYFDCFINFEDFNFVDDKLTVKTLYIYNIDRKNVQMHTYAVAV